MSFRSSVTHTANALVDIINSTAGTLSSSMIGFISGFNSGFRQDPITVLKLWTGIRSASAGLINGAMSGAHLGLMPKICSMRDASLVAWHMGRLAAKKGVIAHHDIPMIVNVLLTHTAHRSTQNPAEIINPPSEKKAQEELAWNEFIADIRRLFSIMLPPRRPTCFISYAWEDDSSSLTHQLLEHDLSRLVNTLQLFDIPVIKDTTHLGSTDFQSWMSDAVSSADFILFIGTELLKNKIDTQRGNIGFEWLQIQAKLKQYPNCFIPILYEASRENAFPAEVLKYNIWDWRNKNIFYPLLFSIENPVGIIPSIFKLAPSGSNPVPTQLYKCYCIRLRTLFQKLTAIQTSNTTTHQAASPFTTSLLRASSKQHLGNLSTPTKSITLLPLHIDELAGALPSDASSSGSSSSSASSSSSTANSSSGSSSSYTRARASSLDSVLRQRKS